MLTGNIQENMNNPITDKMFKNTNNNVSNSNDIYIDKITVVSNNAEDFTDQLRRRIEPGEE